MCIQRQKAKDKNIEFVAKFINISQDESSADEDLMSPVMCCDEHRIMQVLLGLQSNALKFTQRGKVEIIVEIVSNGPDKFIKISVSDTGIGIRREDQHKLFKLFGFV